MTETERNLLRVIERLEEEKEALRKDLEKSRADFATLKRFVNKKDEIVSSWISGIERKYGVSA